jgi:CheY-like chemotaxis protein
MQGEPGARHWHALEASVPRPIGTFMDLKRNPNGPAIKSGPMALILVVDDDSDTVAGLQLLLSVLGFEVATAGSAAEALMSIAERLPDLIITDCEMPQMSGLEFCQTLRDRDQTRDIPIVVYTGKELPDQGPKPYDRSIAKTADADAILSTIQTLLSNRPAHPP